MVGLVGLSAVGTRPTETRVASSREEKQVSPTTIQPCFVPESHASRGFLSARHSPGDLLMEPDHHPGLLPIGALNERSPVTIPFLMEVPGEPFQVPVCGGQEDGEPAFSDLQNVSAVTLIGHFGAPDDRETGVTGQRTGALVIWSLAFP